MQALVEHFLTIRIPFHLDIALARIGCTHRSNQHALIELESCSLSSAYRLQVGGVEKLTMKTGSGLAANRIAHTSSQTHRAANTFCRIPALLGISALVPLVAFPVVVRQWG